MTLAVVTFLWKGPRYGPEHVNILFDALARHLTMPHERIVVTDDTEGIAPGIRIVPLWPHLGERGGCYRRLRAFAPEMEELLGPRFVWLDLDAVICGPLDPLFRRLEDFVIWADPIGPQPYCASMVMMTAGARRQVWEDFDPLRSPGAGRGSGHVGTDQAWIAACLGPGEAVWRRDAGVLSFRRHIAGPRLPGRAARAGRTGELPHDARIVFFHGQRDPSMPELQRRYPWIEQHWRRG